jgi:hypothetical protein
MDHILACLGRCLATKPAFSLTVPLQMPINAVKLELMILIHSSCHRLTLSGLSTPIRERKDPERRKETGILSPWHCHAPSIRSHRGTHTSGFSRLPANESLRRTGLLLYLTAKSSFFSFYHPVFQISCSCRTASDCVSWRWITKLQVEQFHAKTTLCCDLLETLSFCGVLRLRCCLTNSSDSSGGVFFSHFLYAKFTEPPVRNTRNQRIVNYFRGQGFLSVILFGIVRSSVVDRR